MFGNWTRKKLQRFMHVCKCIFFLFFSPVSPEISPYVSVGRNVASYIWMIRSINDKIVLLYSFAVFLTPSITYELMLFFCLFPCWICMFAPIQRFIGQAHLWMISFHSSLNTRAFHIFDWFVFSAFFSLLFFMCSFILYSRAYSNYELFGPLSSKSFC